MVLISGAGSNLIALVDACKRGEVPGRITGVVADRPCRGLEVAGACGLEANVVDFKSYASRQKWSEALRDQVARFRPDLVVSAGFMRITSPVFVDAFAGRFVNLHPSLLPAFPGAHAVRDALDFGVMVTGSTVHFVDREVDHGPIIAQECVPVRPDDSVESLHERIKRVEHRLLPAACRLVLEGRARLVGARTVFEE